MCVCCIMRKKRCRFGWMGGSGRNWERESYNQNILNENNIFSLKKEKKKLKEKKNKCHAQDSSCAKDSSWGGGLFRTIHRDHWCHDPSFERERYWGLEHYGTLPWLLTASHLVEKPGWQCRSSTGGRQRDLLSFSIITRLTLNTNAQGAT